MPLGRPSFAEELAEVAGGFQESRGIAAQAGQAALRDAHERSVGHRIREEELCKTLKVNIQWPIQKELE